MFRVWRRTSCKGTFSCVDRP